MMPIGQNQVITDNIFTNEPRRLVLAMNRNDAFSGTSKTNPFNYQGFGLGKVHIFRGSDQVVGLDTTRDVFSYYDTMESLNIKSDGNGIKLSDFPDHYILVFDLTSTREADSEVYFPDLVGEPLRLKICDCKHCKKWKIWSLDNSGSLQRCTVLRRFVWEFVGKVS